MAQPQAGPSPTPSAGQPPVPQNEIALPPSRATGLYGGAPATGNGDYGYGYTGFQQLPPPPAPVTVASPQVKEVKSTAITVRCTPAVRDEFRNRTMALAALHRVTVEHVNTFILQELIDGGFFNRVQERLVRWQRGESEEHGGTGQA